MEDENKSIEQKERRKYLILELLKERGEYVSVKDLPKDEDEQKKLLHSLFNVRLPSPLSDAFIKVQDEYLQKELKARGIVNYKNAEKVEKHIYLWKGDITRLKIDAIVNAANEELLGCFIPCHSCIDNAIHTFAGLQLREECNVIMQKLGHKEKVGGAKITKAYNLPSKYILHTVGPQVSGELSPLDIKMLRSSYDSCLTLSEGYDIKSIAFPCISTGVFGFPNKEAAEVAVGTIREYVAKTDGKLDILFNVFTNLDEKIYRSLIG